MFCPSLPFSTLEHHWWHVQPLKLLANRLSSFALSPCIIGVKGRCASQLMSQPPPLHSLHKLPQFSGGQRRGRETSGVCILDASVPPPPPVGCLHRLGTSPWRRHQSFSPGCFKRSCSFCRRQTARCSVRVPPALTVHPCNQIMPAEGSGTKTCKF